MPLALLHEHSSAAMLPKHVSVVLPSVTEKTLLSPKTTLHVITVQLTASHFSTAAKCVCHAKLLCYATSSVTYTHTHTLCSNASVVMPPHCDVALEDLEDSSTAEDTAHLYTTDEVEYVTSIAMLSTQH